jgi:hypothetical protein
MFFTKIIVYIIKKYQNNIYIYIYKHDKIMLKTHLNTLIIKHLSQSHFHKQIIIVLLALLFSNQMHNN